MGAIASQTTSLTIVYSPVYSGADQRKHQRSASLAFVREIHRRPVNFPHKLPVARKMCPFDDVVMIRWLLLSTEHRVVPVVAINLLRPRQMDAISQTTFSNAFSWMKMFEFRLKFHWSLFPRVQLTIFQYWLRWWLGAVQATNHYLNQWWLVYWRVYASLGLDELNISDATEMLYQNCHVTCVIWYLADFIDLILNSRDSFYFSNIIHLTPIKLISHGLHLFNFTMI